MSLEGTLDVTVRDDAVTFALSVKNAGDDPVELTFSDAQSADFVVYDGEDVVWQFGEGLGFAQMIREVTLSPGETSVERGTWEDPAPGDYEVEATLSADVDLSLRESFSV